jgi:hypothetical protein
MTIAATAARRRNIAVHLVLWKQKITKNGENNDFQILLFKEKIFPRVHWFDFKIFDINDKKVLLIHHLKVKEGIPRPREVKLSNISSEFHKKGIGLMQNHQLSILTQKEKNIESI